MRLVCSVSPCPDDADYEVTFAHSGTYPYCRHHVWPFYPYASSSAMMLPQKDPRSGVVVKKVG